MSVSASIDISILKNNIYNFSAKDLIAIMINNNWDVKKEDKVCYLPLGDNLFEWTEKNISYSELMELVTQKEENSETIGLILYWKNTNIGVSMLIFDNLQVSFNITMNRRRLKSVRNMDITDINWYVQKIINCFDKFKVTEITFNQVW